MELIWPFDHRLITGLQNILAPILQLKEGKERGLGKEMC